MTQSHPPTPPGRGGPDESPLPASEILPADPRRRVRDDEVGGDGIRGDGIRGDAPPDPGPEVGHPRSAAATSAMLASYLVGRVIAARLSVSLMLIALALLAGAVALWIWVAPVLGVLVGIVALIVLLFRALVMALLRRMMGVGQLGSAERQIRAMVGDTGGDLRRELRRIGLPGSVFGLPLLVIRLFGRRRRETLAKLGHFDVANVVPKKRLDELNFVVRNDILDRGDSTGRGR